ncbi:MAG: UDP-glucose 4-epimerase GalE [Sediminibacterium sp.]|jgi:UDP-glucose 4-epimerase|nr:UDP-glucose 4-epimerase GalE [Sediminibacterium sp.]
MQTILVTGGCGYIGAHTIVDLIENGFNVISVDNLSRSSENSLAGIEKITGKKVKNYNIDLTNAQTAESIFIENPDITGVIHFAAYKAVGESVEMPLAYYENNIFSLVNLLKLAVTYNAMHFIFSSSCTVYGNPDAIPVTEQTPLQPAASPYGATKQMGESIIKDTAFVAPLSTILLRYFNPVGAHPSTAIGELPIGRPQNLVPAITQTAIGKLDTMQVYGDDYDTRDGSCIRDYIHVCDIARAHTLALQYSIKNNQPKSCEIFNLGTGNGITVLEAIKAFEKVSGLALNYQIGPRRAGDIVAIYANNDYAVKKLGWEIKYSLEDMMRTAWDWEKSIAGKN